MTFLEDLKKRILIMDGAMGTTIKSYHIPSKYFLIKGNYYEALNLSIIGFNKSWTSTFKTTAIAHIS